MYNIAKSNTTQTNEIHIPLAPFLCYLYTLTCIQEDSLTKTSGAVHFTWGFWGSNIVINDIQCTSVYVGRENTAVFLLQTTKQRFLCKTFKQNHLPILF